jgi:hypothetical protein
MYTQECVPTDVYMRLVTREGCVVAHTVHPPASALHSQSILDGVDTTLVLRRAAEDSCKARHAEIGTETPAMKDEAAEDGQLDQMATFGSAVCPLHFLFARAGHSPNHVTETSELYIRA